MEKGVNEEMNNTGLVYPPRDELREKEFRYSQA